MRVNLEVKPRVSDVMRSVTADGERAVTKAVRRAGNGLKDDWRNQIRRAGLGNRLAFTTRSANFPKSGFSMSAAALIWSKAPEIVSAFDEGVLIRSKVGLFLAIPTEAAGKRGLGRKRVTPEGWEQRTGLRLRFVYRPNAPSLLVADDARITTRGLATAKRGKRRKDGVLTGAQTVPIFILVPQVKLRKLLNFERANRNWEARLPGMIVDAWDQEEATSNV